MKGARLRHEADDVPALHEHELRQGRLVLSANTVLCLYDMTLYYQ